MSALPASPWFNPRPRIHEIALPGGCCVVIDDALQDPDAWVRWAQAQHFASPQGVPYPGLVAGAPAPLTARMEEFFAAHARARLGARRTTQTQLRFSIVDTPPHLLRPVQWQCHSDMPSAAPSVLFAASVLYLFRDAQLGGTSFYRPLRSDAEIDRMYADAMQLDPVEFATRHAVAPGYMTGSNSWFELVESVPAAWNRMIAYDGRIFHSGHIANPQRLSADPGQGRLTLNGFFTCRRTAQ